MWTAGNAVRAQARVPGRAFVYDATENDSGRRVVTDGAALSLNITEFGAQR